METGVGEAVSSLAVHGELMERDELNWAGDFTNDLTDWIHLRQNPPFWISRPTNSPQNLPMRLYPGSPIGLEIYETH